MNKEITFTLDMDLDRISDEDAKEILLTLDMDSVQTFLSGDKFKLGQCSMITEYPLPENRAYDISLPGDLFIGSDYYGRIAFNLKYGYIVVYGRGDDFMISHIDNHQKENSNMEVIETTIVHGYGHNSAQVNAFNNMEEVIMNKCYAITAKGQPCKKTDITIVQMLVKGIEAVPASEVKPNNMTGGWLLRDVPCCGTHGKGQFIRIQSLRTLEQLVMDVKPEVPKIKTPVVKEGIKCGKCGNNHASIGEVKACYKVTIKLPMRKNKGISCGSCKGFHSHKDEVKACYVAKRS